MTYAEAPATKGRTIRSWARFYDWLDVITLGSGKKVLRTAVRAAAPLPGDAVLDVGCGTGTLALMLAEKVGKDGRVDGIDASPEMIEESRKKAKKAGVSATFQAAAVEAMPFGDGEFDVVTSTYVFHHLPEDVQREGLSEIQRVLKPGGRFVLADFAGGSHSLMGQVIGIVGPLLSRLHGHGSTNHPHGHGQADLKSMMAEAGFEEVEELRTKHKSMAFIRARKAEAR